MRVIFFHGYTGSPYNFHGLDRVLEEKGYEITNTYLPGHGTDLSYLKKMRYDDFYNYAYKIVEEFHHQEPVLIGYSIGAQLALLMAEEFNLQKIVLISIPFKMRWKYTLRFPKFCDTWTAIKPKNERPDTPEKGYEAVPLVGSKIVHHANKAIKREGHNISTKILVIQGTKDKGLKQTNIKKLQEYIPQAQVTLKYVETDAHNPLETSYKEIEEAILSFVQQT